MVPSTSNSHLAHGNDGVASVFTPPINRTASPMQPPPLDPVVLLGFHQDTPATARLLSAPVAEEIRVMVPERLRIEEDWHLVYSLDQDGASLATLYEKCGVYKGKRGGFVLVVRDDEGGVSLCISGHRMANRTPISPTNSLRCRLLERTFPRRRIYHRTTLARASASSGAPR